MVKSEAAEMKMFMSKIQRQGLPTPGWVGAADSGEGAPLSGCSSGVCTGKAVVLPADPQSYPHLQPQASLDHFWGCSPLNFITAPLKITIVKAVEIKMYFSIIS